MPVTVRVFDINSEWWAWMLSVPASIEIGGEGYPSPEELYADLEAGAFEASAEIDGDEVELSHHLPGDYAEQSGAAWSFGQHWGRHMALYEADPAYATAFDEFRGGGTVG